MNLISTTGETIEINITGYQFPDENLPNATDYDLNWLFIQIKVDTKQFSWNGTAPCALVWDMARLGKWLDDIATSQLDILDSFVPLDAEFHLMIIDQSEESVKMEITLDWDYAQPGEKSTTLNFEVQREQFNRASEALRSQLVHFPIRRLNKE